jgi:uncharacterized protein (TIGR00369 family)
VTLTPAEQDRFRANFRAHWEGTVPFNVFSGLRIDRWDVDGVECFIKLRHELSAHKGMLHGGVLAGLIDTCGSGAVMAGHDYELGSRLSTVNLSVQYLSAAPGEDVRAEGRCVRRGRALHFAEARVLSATSNKLLATGQVTVSITGHHPTLTSESTGPA